MGHLKSKLCVLVAVLLLIHTTTLGAATPVQLQSPLRALSEEDEYVVIGFRFPDGTIHKIDGCNQVLSDAATGNIGSVGSAKRLGATPLHVAAVEAPGAISSLTEAGAPLEAKMMGGMTPLHLAIAVGEVAAAVILLEAGADVNTTNDAGATVLHTLYRGTCGSCSPDERSKLARTLIERGASVNTTDNYGVTPLHYAAVGQDAEKSVRELMSLGADVTAKDSNGAPLWFYASMLGDEKAAERVRILSGGKIDDSDDDGKSRDEWVNANKASIDTVSDYFKMDPVVRRVSDDSNSSSIGLGRLQDYFQPKHAADMTLAEQVICGAASAAVCHGACQVLGVGFLYVSCMGACTPLAYTACGYLVPIRKAVSYWEIRSKWSFSSPGFVIVFC